jgi:hypothetical protein
MSKTYREIRELLITMREDGLCGHGASEQQILECEKALSLKLPPSYRSFLAEFGWGYFGSLELLVGLGSDIPKEWEAGANLMRVVSDERRGPLAFPEDVIPFCQNGAGDWYALDCRDSEHVEAPVVFVSHEHGAANGFLARKCADSFAEWLFMRLLGVN